MAILAFILIWLFSSAAANRGRGGRDPRRPSQRPRGEWPPMPGWPPGGPAQRRAPAQVDGREQPGPAPDLIETAPPEPGILQALDAAELPLVRTGAARDQAGATPQLASATAGEGGGLAFEFLGPDRMVSAIVLSEIIGPPRCRRPASRFFAAPCRNRHYSGGGREGGAERGTDKE